MASDLQSQIAARDAVLTMGGRDVFAKAHAWEIADQARAMGFYPYFRPLDYNDGPEAVLEGRRVLMFGSNNYLGLTTHPKVRELAAEAVRRYGTSMTGSRLLNGTMKLHRELEERLAAFHGKEAGLVFTTGYHVNLASLQALVTKKVVAYLDMEDHASIYDGVQLAGGKLVRYRHNNPDDLDKKLERLEPEEGALIITDGVFSTAGSVAKLPALVAVARKHGARTLVDDAHGLGVLGPGGRGTAAHFGLVDQVDLIGGTFSKTLASVGGWLVGERRVLDFIQHFGRSFVFAAAPAPSCVAAALAALQIMSEEPERAEKLRENFTYMRLGLQGMGYNTGPTETAVIPLYIGDEWKTIMLWKDLLEEANVYTNPFISPGVPRNKALIRTSYMATHTREQLDRGLEAFRKYGRKHEVIPG
jgi:8-amino-7-oxononanoate synthase